MIMIMINLKNYLKNHYRILFFKLMIQFATNIRIIKNVFDLLSEKVKKNSIGIVNE